jgi:hypothetical protein
MRRGLASLIIGLSLLVATLSWAGFTLSRTILDPGRSERLAYQLVDNPEVRAALVSRLSDQLEAQIPPEAPVPRSVVETGAATALDDPRVRALIVDGMVLVHQNALNGNPEPVVLDAGALGSAGRDALVATRPELDAFLPASPPVALELPTAGLTWLATVKGYVDRFTLLGAVVAGFGAFTAFAVARNRASVLRRVAFWGYGAAAFWLLVGYAVPWLGGFLSPTSGAIAAAAVDVFFGAMIRPAVVLAVFSTVLLVAGFALPGVARQRAARVLQPARAPGFAGAIGQPTAVAAGPAPRLAAPPLVNRPAHLSTVQPTYRSLPPRAPHAASAPTPASAGPAGGNRPGPPRTSPGEPWQPRGSVDHTDEMLLPNRPATPPRPGPEPGPTPGAPPPAAPVWEEGVGYLDDEGRGPRVDPFG